MIVLDSSAIVAILLNEPDAPQVKALVSQRRRIIGAPTLCEARMALDRRLTGQVWQTVERFVIDEGVEVVSFDEAMAVEGIAAFHRSGKGRGHPAQMNFGDCLSYAVAKSRNLPLLFTGGDLPHTDLVPAYAPGV